MIYSDDFIEALKEDAESLLAPLGNRWLHVQGVVLQAQRIKHLFAASEGRRLVAAAYTHDIGYAPSLKITGFHPLDGAYYLRSCGYNDLASLVAYHSEARFEARLRDLEEALFAFPREQSLTTDALIYCDLTTNPMGETISLNGRVTDVFTRYGENDLVSQALRLALPSLTLAIQRIEQRLHSSGEPESISE